MYITINSEFKPFTYDELTKPLRDYTEAYNKAEEQYATLAQQTEAWKNIATQENSPEAYAMYKKYSDELNAVVEDFSKGMTMQNRSKLLGLKSRYASEMGSIDRAYKKYNEMNTTRDALVAADSSIVFTTNYRSMDDFLHGEVADNSFVSGKQLEATTASRAQAAAYNKVNELISAGVNADLAASTVISSPTFKEEIINDSLSSIDLSAFDEESQAKIRSYVSLGVDTGIGTFATQEYMTAAQRAAQKAQNSRMAAELSAKGFTPGGKIDPGNPIWKGQGYEFATKEDGTYMKDSSGNPIVTKAPSGSGKVSIPLPGLNVDIDISTFDYGTIDPGTYILGDLAMDSPIRKAIKDSGLFKGLPEIDYSKYRVRITEVDGKGTFMKVTKIPTVTSSVNPDTQDAADVTLGL